ncbi:MAG: HAMP domain-containing protein, partial [Euryarchaeota archaeon]|nr:HAMP domain-containing protein [Euryarchaeota archaeon]
MATIKTGLDTKKNLLRLLEFKSIKTKLTVIIVVMLIVSGTILTGAAALMATGALTESTLNTLDAVGDGNSEKLSLVIETGKNIAATISMEKEVVGLMEQLNAGNDMADEQISVGLHLAEIANALPLSLTAINVYNLDGIIVASSNPSILGRDDSKIDYIVNQQKEAYMAAPVRGTGDVPILPFGRPVYDSGRQQIGLISFGAQYAGVSDTVFSTPGLSEGATSFLVGPDGMILSSVNGDFSPFLTKKFDLSIFSPGETMVQGLGYFGLPAYIGKTPVPGTDYSIITTERVEEVNNPIMGLIMTMVVCLLIVIVAGAFVTIFIAKGFARPIQILKEAATQLALGDVGVAITHTGIDEIGQLADSFRSMIENKKDNAQAVSKIAAGDVAHMINAASDQDVEGHALIQMKKTLASMTASLEALARRSAEGDLSYRAESDQFKGVYRELIDTLN